MFETFRQELIRSISPRDMEDLIRTAAASATGLPFRQAKSGSQPGSDFSTEAVKVEVKAYSNKPPGEESLLGKLARAARFETEIWVLAVTTAIPSQTWDELKATGRKLGIHVVLLDWPSSNLPPLLVLLACAQDATLEWLSRKCSSMTPLAKEVLERIRATMEFPEHAETLRHDLVPVLASYTSTRRAMQAIYLSAFADRRQAMSLFLQALTPLVNSKVVERVKVLDRIDQCLTESPDQPLVILGDEGVGKTWLVASYWLRRSRDSLLVLIPSKSVLAEEKGNPIALLEGSIATTLATVRLDSWPSPSRLIQRLRNTRDPKRKLLVVLDGLNEQPSVPWVRLIPEMQSLMLEMGGRLIITCRPRFWDRELAPRIDIAARCCEYVAGFDDEEFSEALSRLHRDPTLFSRELRGELRNPRIFAIASELLDELKDDVAVITKERVLWEYWRHRSKGSNSIVLSDDGFRRLLMRHAHDAWQEMQADPDLALSFPQGRELPGLRDAMELARGEPVQQLVADLTDVADGHFFHLVPGLATAQYTFVPDKLWYALGLELAFMALEAKRYTKTLDALRERLTHFLEPVLEMDVAADIISAALGVSVFVPEMGRTIACLFLLEFTDLRNRRNDEDIHNRKGDVLSYIGRATGAYVDAAEHLLEAPPHFDDWIIDALRLSSQLEGKAQQVTEAAMRRWLGGKPFALASDVALRILVGQDSAAFRKELQALRENGSGETILWFDVLDEANPFATSFVGPHRSGTGAFLVSGAEAEPSNQHLKFLLSQWRVATKTRVPKHHWRVGSKLFQRPWSLALAPSLLSWLPLAVDSELQTLYQAGLAKSDPGNAFQHLLATRLVATPVNDRIGLLAQLSKDAAAESPDVGISFLPDLGLNGADRYLSRILSEAGFPKSELTREGLDRVRFALDFLRGDWNLTLSDASQSFLFGAILNDPWPVQFRTSAIAVAAQCSAGWIAQRLAADLWSPKHQVNPEIATEGSALLLSATAIPGIYSQIRERILHSCLASALATIHPRDFQLAACVPIAAKRVLPKESLSPRW